MNFVTRLRFLFTDPLVSPFVECPNCKQLLELGVDIANYFAVVGKHPIIRL